MKIKVKKLNEFAILPTRANPTDAGADLYSTEDVWISPGERRLVGTGIALEIFPGYVGLIHPRSGLAHNFGLSIVNSPGTIDSDYRGELKINLINLGTGTLHIEVGDRIAQLLIQKVKLVGFEEVSHLSPTKRGENGHGSTGGFNGGI